MSNKQNSILFVSQSGIGNLIMQLAAIKRFKKEHPEWKVDVWVDPKRNTANLAKIIPDIDEVISAPIKRSALGHVVQIWKMGRQKYQAGVVLYPGQQIKSAAYLWLMNVKQRIGHRYSWLGNPDSALFLSKAITVRTNTHDVDQNIYLLKEAGLVGEGNEYESYEITIPQKYCLLAERYAQEAKLPADKKFIGLHAGSNKNFSWKRWPAENFATLGKYLVKKGYHVLLFGNQEEMRLNKDIRQRIGKHHVSIVSAKLMVTAALIKKCEYFISNDSGLMHLAAAAGTKTYGIFGPTDETRTGPRGTNSQVIRAPGTKPVYDVNDNYDLGTETHDSLTLVTPQMVIAKLGEDY